MSKLKVTRTLVAALLGRHEAVLTLSDGKFYRRNATTGAVEEIVTAPPAVEGPRPMTFSINSDGNGVWTLYHVDGIVPAPTGYSVTYVNGNITKLNLPAAIRARIAGRQSGAGMEGAYGERFYWTIYVEEPDVYVEFYTAAGLAFNMAALEARFMFTLALRGA